MLQSSLIGKVQKANRYAKERNRVSLFSVTAAFQGEHNRYFIEYDRGKWRCSCHFFDMHGMCSHTMALQKMLGEMLPEEKTEQDN